MEVGDCRNKRCCFSNFLLWFAISPNPSTSYFRVQRYTIFPNAVIFSILYFRPCALPAQHRDAISHVKRIKKSRNIAFLQSFAEFCNEQRQKISGQLYVSGKCLLYLYRHSNKHGSVRHSRQANLGTSIRVENRPASYRVIPFGV